MFWLRRMLDPDPEGTQGGGGDDTVVKVDHADPSSQSGKTPPPEVKLNDVLPAEYKDKPFFKDKSLTDVFKDHVNLQTLLGQRPAGIPKDDANPEEWGKFLGALKPKTSDEYVLPETDYSKAKGRTDEYTKNVKEILYNANVNKHQATKIIEGFEKFLEGAQASNDAKLAETAKAREVEFETLLDKTYKDQKPLVLDRVKGLMKEVIDPALANHVEGVLKDISNETLFALTAVLDGVYRKYVAEDSTPGASSANAVGDKASWQSEAEEIMKSAEYRDFRRAGHENAKQRVRDLFEKIAAVK